MKSNVSKQARRHCIREKDSDFFTNLCLTELHDHLITDVTQSSHTLAPGAHLPRTQVPGSAGGDTESLSKKQRDFSMFSVTLRQNA